MRFAPITANADIDLQGHREAKANARLFHFGLRKLFGFF
jgi:hypothetical protein